MKAATSVGRKEVENNLVEGSANTRTTFGIEIEGTMIAVSGAG